MKKKIFIISGASSGIFQEILKKKLFRREKIVAIYNSAIKLNKSNNIDYIKIDFTNKSNLNRHFKMIKKYKKIIFINFASRKSNKTLLNITKDDFINDFKINTLSYFEICKILLPEMMKSHWGRIINISSTGGEKGDIGTTSYTATKLASNGITNIISKEFARFSITSNTIKLGNFNTGMFSNLNDDLKKKLLKEIPAGKTGNVKNIYKAINFLINSEYANNATINIDGGYR